MTVVLLQVSTWDPLFVRAIREHYTGSKGPPPGKKLAWRIVAGGHHIGWIGVGEPAYKLAARRRLGLADARPLPGTVCCFIYRRERSGGPAGGEIISTYHDVAAAEWSRRWGQVIEHWESMVDSSEVASSVPGSCFRRAGYRSLGETTGRSARRPPGASRGPRVWTDSSKKMVFYRGPLSRVPP